jgi:hypothetical protein
MRFSSALHLPPPKPDCATMNGRSDLDRPPKHLESGLGLFGLSVSRNYRQDDSRRRVTVVKQMLLRKD